PFSLGELINTITDHYNLNLDIPMEELLTLVLQNAEQEFQADFHEGYWTDHWTYNLDLIESYLAVYPDKKEYLLFEDCSYCFYDSEMCVNPRDKKHVISNGKPFQLNAIFENEAKKAMITSRTDFPNLLRIQNGKGKIYKTSLISKLFLLALIKFSTSDPGGMGIEMEAGKPGWYDAMNGLPGLFGSSMPETFELKRLLEFIVSVSGEFPSHRLEIPLEANALLDAVLCCLKVFMESDSNNRDFIYWDSVSSARENYRYQIQFGFDGQEISIALQKLSEVLKQFIHKIDKGIKRALDLNSGLPPTYFYYQVDRFKYVKNVELQPETDSNGHPYIRVEKFTPVILPLFLEGFVRALKVNPPDRVKTLYEKVKTSDLFDQKLKMYKVNESLENQPHELGRARAFTPGWLENESIWLHMEYKYLLEVLKAGLYDQFFDDFKNVLIPFLDAERYGRSPTENSSFLVSSAHPDSRLHGVGFVARLSGSTAEFLSIWFIMMAGKTPFFMKDGQLHLQFKPILPGWLFNADGMLSFCFLGNCWVTYHNPLKKNTYIESVSTQKVILQIKGTNPIEIPGGLIPSYLAEMVRCGEISKIDIFLQSNP
ncbi:MAG: cellobiose phosphorylase, partial [Anaerolineales bacterium]